MGEMIIRGADPPRPAADLSAALFEDFAQFIDRGEKTTRTYITNLRQFVAWLRFRSINRPVRRDIISYRQYLQTEHEAIRLDPENPRGWAYRLNSSGKRYSVTCKPRTVAQYMRSVCQFFRWTAANGYYPNIADNLHAPAIRHDMHAKDALRAADVLRIEESIRERAEAATEAARAAGKDSAGRIQRSEEQGLRLLAMYTLAVNAGLRTIELSRANVRDIEIRNGRAVMYVWGKGHTEPDRKKPLAPEVYDLIREYLESRSDRPTGNSPLFVATGNRSGGRRLAETTISTMLKKALRAAGYDSERITAHSLRHTAGTEVMELTGNIYQAQQYMRHSSPATTEIYLHNDTERQEEETAQRLYNRYHGRADPRDPSQILRNLKPEQLQKILTIVGNISG